MTEEKIKQDKLSLEESLDERILNKVLEEYCRTNSTYKDFPIKEAIELLSGYKQPCELINLTIKLCREEFEKEMKTKEWYISSIRKINYDIDLIQQQERQKIIGQFLSKELVLRKIMNGEIINGLVNEIDYNESLTSTGRARVREHLLAYKREILKILNECSFEENLEEIGGKK